MMTKKPVTPKPGIWKILWPILFPFGIEQDWEPGTMPGWRKTASAFWVGGVLLPIAAVTLFGIIGTMSPGGGGNDEGPDPTCYPSLRC